MTILVTYDLNRAKNYKKLYVALKEIGNAVKDPNLDSVWFIDTQYELSAIQEHIKRAMGVDDRFVVVKMTSEEYVGVLSSKDMWNWIDSRT